MSNSIYNHSEKYAQDIVSSFDLTPPIDLNKICKKLNIKYREGGSNEEGYSIYTIIKSFK